MNKNDVFKIFDIEDLKDLPNAIMALLEGDLDTRNNVYKELIRLNNYDMSYDWFQEMYESELSERKQKGQDFTSPEVSGILSDIVGQKGKTIHEPTAGCGGLIIVDWWKRCKKKMIWEHFPSENMVTCWELSARSIPILLLNLSIRGIMGYVYHGDEMFCEPRTYRNYYKHLILDEVGLDRCIKFHGLRHSFATRMIASKADMKTTSRILGHSDVSTTMNLYVHPSMSDKLEAVNKSMKNLFKK